MPISTVTIYNFINHKYKCDKGFTLVEILIALSLIGLLFTLVVNVSGTSRQDLEDSIGKLERAVRFATNESILRNSIVRINIDLDTEPIEYSIQYGQGANFILPQSVDLSSLSIRERELEMEKMKKLDSQFAKVEEFSDSNEKLADDIFIYGVTTTYTPNLIETGQANIYFYPTGERDSSLIIIYNDEEIATIAVSPFEDNTQVNFSPISEQEFANLEYSLETRSKELIEQWLKD